MYIMLFASFAVGAVGVRGIQNGDAPDKFGWMVEV
jgi:hypothetical protein